MNEYLFRKNIEKYRTELDEKFVEKKKAKVLSIASGKGGVGKTFFSTNFARFLESINRKVLLIDCDVFLSNCYLSLGVTPSRDIFDLIDGEEIGSCITTVGNIDLLSGRSGNDTGASSEEYVKTILGVIQSCEFCYDYILLDCPAGIEGKILSLMAFADERVLVMNPDKYSLTDAYSLIKTLRTKYGVLDYITIVNKCDSIEDEQEMFNRIISTCQTFLPDVRVCNRGSIPNYKNKSFEQEKNSTSKFFNNLFFHLDDIYKDHGLVGHKKMEMDFHLSF